MRCWHKDLIPVLPKQQLMGQWRECCLIARSIEKHGTPNHLLVNRIMDYPMDHFWTYGPFLDLWPNGGKGDGQAWLQGRL